MSQVWLELDLKASKQINNTNDVDQKLVLIHPDAAAAIDIRDGEPALLIAGGRKGEEVSMSPRSNAAICKVRVSPPDITSPKKKKTMDIVPGEIHLMSRWLLRRLFSDLTASGAQSDESPADDSSSTKPASFTSPSKTTFSFAKGGGGDALISPSQKSTPSKSGFSFAKRGGGDVLISPQKHSTPASNKKIDAENCPRTLRCILVPLHNLDKWQSHRLCPDADIIVLSPISSTSDEVKDTETSSVHHETRQINPSLLSSRTVIQTLIASKYHGSFLCSRQLTSTTSASQKFEVLSIVFRGQPELFRVMNAIPRASKSNKDDEVNNFLSHTINELQISEKSHGANARVIEDTSTQSTTLGQLLNKHIKTNDANKEDYIGFKITSRTRIQFMGHDEIQKQTLNKADMTHHNSSKLCAGLDSILSRIRDALLPPILNPQLFPVDGPLRPPKGVLLYGPAGVGKSLLAAQISQDLSASDSTTKAKKIHVQTIKCADLLASTAVVGEAESILTGIFKKAERGATDSAGSLVILDDVHLICPRRGGIGLGVDQLAGTLLALLDGIGTSNAASKGGFVVLAITTDPSLLDPALRRSGRLDTEVDVPVPDDIARGEILRFHIEQLITSVKSNTQQNVNIDDEKMKALARLAKGFTGADCKLAIKEAVRNSIKRSLSNKNTESGITIEYSDLEHGIRSTKPSAIKSVAVEVPHVQWSSIGGMEHVKSLLRESIELPLTHPHLFEMMKVPPPKGILLYGPPGCSKTLMARAIATEGQMNFLAVKGPELLSKWLGESERALASLFRRARLASPSVIFFDEVDAIASRRGEGGGGGGDRLLSQLLTELDGVSSGAGGSGGKPCRVVVVGATNRPDTLDPALTRPGRMDRMIYVGLPASDGRKSIFEIGLKGKACHDDVDLSVLASDDISKGYSGAEIVAICRDAALHAIGEMVDGSTDTPRIRIRHLLQSIKDMKPRTTAEMLDFYKSFRGQH